MTEAREKAKFTPGPWGANFHHRLQRADQKTQLDKAERHLARTMYQGIVGLEEREAEDDARRKRIQLVDRYGPLSAVEHLYAEAARYENM